MEVVESSSWLFSPFILSEDIFAWDFSTLAACLDAAGFVDELGVEFLSLILEG